MDGIELRTLRAQLELDSGHLTRIVQALVADELATVQESALDGRVRTARLTRAGKREREELDRRADAAAATILEPLSESQRDRLVRAMGEVERLLTASLVRIAPCDPGHPHARESPAAYFAELDERFESGFDASLVRDDPADLVPPRGLVLVATLDGRAVGCGVLRLHESADGDVECAELKRIWVAGEMRGLGLGRRLLSELERHAVLAGARIARLDTNRVLVEAIDMYRSSGYREIAPFTDHPYAHHWFEKELDPAQATAASTRSTKSGSGTEPAQA